MSREIDERVVEMRFDNKQFEEETKKTMSTLERLKEALKFTKSGEGLKNLQKTASDIRLDGIAAGVEMLTKRFSTFGIVGMQIIQNVTNALTGKLVAAVNYATDAIVNGGIRRAFNIENAHFQLQALLKDEEKVQAVMANANEAVTGTAYGYDEAAKAASQFAASGIEAGEEMLNALKGITGVAAMTNSEFEAISMIFTTVAGNGRLMGDQLLQLSSRGLNAASTIVDYMKEVQGQSKITETDVRDMVSKGEISFKLFSDAMTWAFGDSAKRANETFNGAMSNMKAALSRIGAEFISPLIEQNGVLVDLFNALRERINEIKTGLTFDSATSSVEGFARALNISDKQAQKIYKTVEKQGSVTTKVMKKIENHQQDGYKVVADYMNKVTDGSVRTSYAVTTTIEKLSKGTKVTSDDIRRMVKKGKIDFSLFSNAFEDAFGTQHQKLSKRFTTAAITAIDTVRNVVENLDLRKPLELTNKSVDIIIHSVQALGKVLTPVGKSFYNVFLKDFNFGMGNVVYGAKRLDILIKNFKLSESASKNLERTFTGLFDIVALVGDGFLGLIRAVLPLGGTLGEAGGGALELAGNLGEALSKFSAWVRTSPKVQKAFTTFQKAIQTVAKGLSTAGNGIWDFIVMVSKMPQVKAIVNGIGDIFSKTGSVIQKGAELMVDSVSSFIEAIRKIDFTDPRTMMKSFGDAVEDLAGSLMKYDSIRIFVTNFQQFLDNLGAAFSRDNITGKIDGVKQAFSTLGDNVKKVWSFLSPVFDNINLGGVAATGTGVGIVASMVKISKALEGVAESIKSVPNVLGAVKGTLEEYQKNLKADTIKKIAEAIALLAASVLLLSFADPAGVQNATIVIGMLGTVLAAAMVSLGQVLDTAKSVPGAIDSLASGFGKAVNNLAKTLKWKAIGGAIKSIGETALMIGGTIVVIALMWRKDPQAMQKGIQVVQDMAIGITLMITAMSLVGSLTSRGMKAFAAAATGVLELSVAMLIIVTSINKIMKMDIPTDFESRMQIFYDVIVALAALTAVIAVAGKVAGGEKLSIAGPIAALAAMLVVTVSSLKKLFKMDMPSDWGWRFAMLEVIFVNLGAIAMALALAARLAGGNSMKSLGAPIAALCLLLVTTVGSLKALFKMDMPRDWILRFAMLEVIFVTLGGLMAVIGKSVGDANGAIKAGGTILAMCAFLATATASLMVLSALSWGGILKGAVALGIVLVSLATTLYGAGQISNDNTYKAVLAMAATVGAITASLGILSMISIGDLAKSVTALGTMLLALAIDFMAVSKVTNEKAFINILAMIAAMSAVVAALVILSAQPWEGLLAAGVSLGLTLTAFASCMQVVSKSSGIKLEKITAFVLASTALIPIGVSLAVIATQPWDGILAAGVALSATILAFAQCMKMVSAARGIKMEKIVAFVTASLAFIPMTVSLAVLADKPWEGLIAAAVSLGSMILAMSAAMAIITKMNVSVTSALDGVLALDLFIGNLAGVITAFGVLNKIDGFQQLIEGGGDLLGKVGEAFGKLISGFGVGLASGLPAIGQSLAEFSLYLPPFIIAMKTIDGAALKGCTALVAMIGELAVASFISGITKLLTLGKGFTGLGKMLVDFAPYVAEFGRQISGINPVAVTAASMCGTMLADLADKLPKEGGLAQAIFGESIGLDEFGVQILAFGAAIAPFAEMVKDVKPAAVKGAAAAGELLADLAGKLPKEGGLAQAVFGETIGMDEFGMQLLGFGMAIVPFCAMVKDVKPKAVKGAASAGELLANLANNLPKEGGLVASIFGDTLDIDEFGIQLLGFGHAIVPFCDMVKDIKPTSVMGAAMVTNVMTSIAKSLPEEQNVIEKWFGGGTLSLSKFGEEIAAFGPHIVSFSEAVKSVKVSSITGAMSAVQVITTTMKAVTNDKYTSGALKNFGNELEKFGASLKKFYKEMASADFSKINTITANIKKLSNAAKEAGTESMNSFVKGINSNSGSVVTAMREMIETVIEALNKTHARFTANGKIAGKKFIDGIHAALTSASNISKIKTAGNTLGKNYAEGLANGIKNNTSLVTAAARSMAAKADQEVSKVLDEHSPSKLAEKRGKWYDEGLAIGLRKSAKLVAEEAGKLGGVVNASLTNSLAKAGPLSLQRTIKSLAELDKELKIEKMAKAINKHIAEISLSLYGLSKPAKEMADAVSNGFSSMTSTVAKATENISKLQKEYEAQQKKLEKEQEAQQKREEELQEEYEKWVDYYSKTKKERAEAAKEAKKQAAIEAKAYAKTYGGLKTAQVKAIDFTDEYYEKLLKITRTGNNKLLYEDKSLEEAKIDILQRITDAYQSYLDSYTQTQQSFMDQIGFFDKVAEETQSSVSVNPFSEVTKNEAKTKEELFQIANDQITLYTDFVDTQTRLLERIGDTGLGDYIRELGVDSYEQLQVLNTMTEEELQLYAQAYDRTYEAISKTVKETDVVSKESLLKNARDQVKVYEEFVKTQSEIMARLQGTALGDYVMTLGIDQKDEMDAILSMTDAELNEYVGLYDQKFAMSGVAAKNQLSKTQAEIEQSIVDILQGVVQKVNLWEWDFDGSIESIIGSVKKTTKKAKKGIDKVLTSYASALASNMNASIGTPIGTAIAAGMSAKQLETAISKSGKQNDPINVVKKTVEASGDKNKPVAETKGKELAQSGVTGVKKMQSSFYDAGQKAGQKVAEGLRSQTEAVRSAAAALQAAASAAATSAGASTGNGFASGVKSTASAVVGASIGIGAGAVSALKGSLKIHSPSKVTEKLGDYTVLGFVNSLMQGVAKVAIASEELGDAAKDGMETGLDDISKVFTDSDLDVTPVIQPVVDLSGVEQSIRDITRMFNDAIQVVSANVEVAADVMRLRTKHTEEADRGSDGEPVVNNYTFNQTNNSPKALSSIDIYRSTNNQFAQFREAVSRA